MSAGISTIPELIADIRDGRMVILVDEEDRENEGDLLLAAQFATPENINFMARYGRGLICLTLTAARCEQLNLPPMVGTNRSRLGTNFTVSIEAAEGVTTGISAADRARTICAAVAKEATPADILSSPIAPRAVAVDIPPCLAAALGVLLIPWIFGILRKEPLLAPFSAKR